MGVNIELDRIQRKVQTLHNDIIAQNNDLPTSTQWDKWDKYTFDQYNKTNWERFDKYDSVRDNETLVIIQATPFCNLDCSYCYLPDREIKEIASGSTLKNIFDALLDSKVVSNDFSIVWHAGEPLVLPISFYESAISLQKQSNNSGRIITNCFQTNGTLLNEDWCAFIKANDIRIGISLDGPKEIHDANRKYRQGKGTFDRVMAGIELLKNKGIDFTVISVLSENSLMHPDEIFNFFMESDIKTFGFNTEEAEGANEKSTLDTPDGHIRYKAFFDRIIQLLENSGRNDIHIREIDRILDIVRGGNPKVKHQENTPAAIINFDYKGNISTFSPELLTLTNIPGSRFIFGNVNKGDSIEAALLSRDFMRTYSEIQEGVLNCKETCEYFCVCGGGSPSNKFCETGELSITETIACKLRVKTTIDSVLEHLSTNSNLLRRPIRISGVS